MFLYFSPLWCGGRGILSVGILSYCVVRDFVSVRREWISESVVHLAETGTARHVITDALWELWQTEFWVGIFICEVWITSAEWGARWRCYCVLVIYPGHSSRIGDFRFKNSLKFANFITFLKFVKTRKKLFGTLGLWAHSTGCSGAVARLINMQQQQMNLGQ